MADENTPNEQATSVGFIYGNNIQLNNLDDGNIIFDTGTRPKNTLEETIDLFLKYNDKVYKVHPQILYNDIKDLYTNNNWMVNIGDQEHPEGHPGFIDTTNYSKLLPFIIEVSDTDDQYKIDIKSSANNQNQSLIQTNLTLGQVLAQINPGQENGTLSVGDRTVPITGLRSAAFTESQTYEETKDAAQTGQLISNWATLENSQTEETNTSEGGE